VLRSQAKRLSIVVPVFNGSGTLPLCLRALGDSSYLPFEFFVVDDGSSDNSLAIAEQFSATILSTGGRFGPSKARNLAARHATGEVLVFLDADVAVHPDALARIAEHFESDPALDALIGSYDDSPSDPGFVSQFKNLMHAFVHSQGNDQAFTFWCGCGAVRRTVYLDHGGLDESYERPSIEDIELGYRMRAAGRKIALDPQVQCKHLKTWTLWSMVRTDVQQRGISWTELILRTRVLADDLNLRWGQRASVALSGLTLVLAAMGSALTTCASLACLLAICWINRDFYAFLGLRKGLPFAVAAIPLHLLYFLYSGTSFVLGTVSHLVRQARSSSRPLKPILRPEIENNTEC